MEMKSKAAKTWHLHVHLSYLFLQGIFKIQVLLKWKNEKTGTEKKKKKRKKVQNVLRPEWNASGMEARHFIEPVEWLSQQ